MEWFSADTVIKRGIKWYPGSGVGGRQMDKDKKIIYSYSITQIDDELRLATWYGAVADLKIIKITLEVEESNAA